MMIKLIHETQVFEHTFIYSRVELLAKYGFVDPAGNALHSANKVIFSRPDMKILAKYREHLQIDLRIEPSVVLIEVSLDPRIVARYDVNGLEEVNYE